MKGLRDELNGDQRKTPRTNRFGLLSVRIRTVKKLKTRFETVPVAQVLQIAKPLEEGEPAGSLSKNDGRRQRGLANSFLAQPNLRTEKRNAKTSLCRGR